jgi:REP element-mobilizing transposase RayT
MDYRARKSPRLPGYDYSQHGAYFVTVCVQRRRWLFGDITDDQMHLSPAGQMVARYWERVSNHFPAVDLDVFVVMPNHLHAILLLEDDRIVSLPAVLQWFKITTTNAYSRGVREEGWLPFEGKLWQRSYHDHIIRDADDLNRIREYVLYNPTRWQDDRLRDAE